MKNPQVFDKLKNLVLENATRLKLSDLVIGDRARLDASQIPEKNVLILHTKKGESVDNECKHYDYMPYHPLPNACVYGIARTSHNWVPALFGVMDRMFKDGRVVLNWKNVEANNFIRYYFNSMGWDRDQGRSRKYWRKGLKLLRNRSFQLMALNHVYPNWHMHLTKDQVKSILDSVNKIIENKEIVIPLRRVYIPKPNNKWRPLGVPEIPWRIYLHMWNNLLVWWRQGRDNNHAYFPGKGIHTAWKDLLPKLLRYKHTYEFDLLSFFPSVTLKELYKVLTEELDVPEDIANYLIELHRSITVLPKEVRLDEASDIECLLQPSGASNPNLRGNLKDQVNQILSSTHRNSMDQFEKLHSLLPKGWSLYRTYGIPQGTATSCGLATISLSNLWRRFQERLVMYADDGIVFPKNPEDIVGLSDKVRGIKPSEEKSKWVKKDGNWLEESIKFLGIRFYAETSTEDARLESSTRNGAKLDFNLAAQLSIYLKIEWSKIVDIYHKENIRSQNTRNFYSPFSSPKSQTVIEKIKSSTSLNQNIKTSTRSLHNITIEEWLRKKMDEFQQLSIESRLLLLFHDKGLGVLTEMFNGKWGKSHYESGVKYIKGSWLHVAGPHYQYRELKENWNIVLLQMYVKKIIKSGLKVNWPTFPEDLWSYHWYEGLEGDELSLALKIEESMRICHNTLEYWKNTKSFELTLNSLFKWNIPTEKSPVIKELREVLIELLRHLPFDLESMSTLATAELLSQDFFETKDIRYSPFLKTKWILTPKWNLREKWPEKPISRKVLREFKNDMGISNSKLIKIMPLFDRVSSKVEK